MYDKLLYLFNVSLGGPMKNKETIKSRIAQKRAARKIARRTNRVVQEEPNKIKPIEINSPNH